jgi:hypothetical protein
LCPLVEPLGVVAAHCDEIRDRTSLSCPARLTPWVAGTTPLMLMDILIAVVIVAIAAVLGIVVHPVLWIIVIAAVLWLFVRRGAHHSRL